MLSRNLFTLPRVITVLISLLFRNRKFFSLLFEMSMAEL